MSWDKSDIEAAIRDKAKVLDRFIISEQVKFETVSTALILEACMVAGEAMAQNYGISVEVIGFKIFDAMMVRADQMKAQQQAGQSSIIVPRPPGMHN